MQLNHAILVQVLFGVSDELRLLTGARRKLNLLKLVLTGDGRVGKTSLLRCLRGEPFNEDEPSTCGVELCTVEVGAEKWAATNLAAVGDFADLLADEFRAQQRDSDAAVAAADSFELRAQQHDFDVANPSVHVLQHGHASW